MVTIFFILDAIRHPATYILQRQGRCEMRPTQQKRIARDRLVWLLSAQANPTIFKNNTLEHRVIIASRRARRGIVESLMYQPERRIKRLEQLTGKPWWCTK